MVDPMSEIIINRDFDMSKTSSSLVFKNGSIYTVDKDLTWAQAIAVNNGKIVFVGSNENVVPYIGPETVLIDLEEKMVLPGFVDAHAHPSHAMDLVGNISLYSGENLDDYVRIITEFVNKHPERKFYRGSGWADTFFSNMGPDKEILDAIIPDKPIALISYDGHSMWVNSVTLEMANITKETGEPDGGRIERDPETGNPSGTLRETAFKLIEDVIPKH